VEGLSSVSLSMSLAGILSRASTDLFFFSSGLLGFQEDFF